jgi:hypothetical protein
MDEPMRRLCERPGCSDRASVAYGMRPEDLVFWLDVADDASSVLGGVLCQRHADSMVVPRGWTLDDLRDPDLHLFRPPDREERPRRRTARAHHDDVVGEQLEFGVDASPSDVDVDPMADDGRPPSSVESERSGEKTPDEAPEGPPEVWSPAFDSKDDLNGLLAARSPLLARAFRGDDRPR